MTKLMSEKPIDGPAKRSATTANRFDHFWRNARTHTHRNPAEFRKRTLDTIVLESLFPESGLQR
jgi:hypothetical protein